MLNLTRVFFRRMEGFDTKGEGKVREEKPGELESREAHMSLHGTLCVLREASEGFNQLILPCPSPFS